MKSLPLFIAQAAEAPAPVETAATEGTPAETPQGGLFGGGNDMMIILMFGFGLMYFMMIRPQNRREKERQKMIAELRAGRRVSFAGGFIGTITEAREKTFMIEIAPQVSVEVSRASVSGPVDEAAPENAKK